MIRRKILYILIVTACIWLCMLYTFQGLRFFLGILLVLPVVCLFSVLIQAAFCRVEAGEIPPFATRGNCVILSLKAIHNGVLPLASLRADVRWASYGEKSVRHKQKIRGMGGRSVKQMEYTFPAAHCGRSEFTVARAKIYDCLGLFYVPIKKSGGGTVMIMPVVAPLGENEMEMISGLLNRSSAVKDGDYFIREYRPGDNLRSIHWKLTAREEEFQVRDRDADYSVNLFLNMTDELLADPDRRDAFLDRACSVMAFFSEIAVEGYNVFWSRDGILCCYRIETGEELQLCIMELLELKKIGSVGEDEIASLKLGCHLEPDGRLYIGEQCAYEK